jgi:hypothetical protein
MTAQPVGTRRRCLQAPEHALDAAGFEQHSVTSGLCAGERLHHPLHAHEARTLDQHGDAGRKQGPQRGQQRIDIAVVLRARAERCRRMGASSPRRYRRSTFAARAKRPISAWKAAPCAPTSPMSPNTRNFIPAWRESTAMAARTESGLAL